MRKHKISLKFKRNIPLHIMLIPGLLAVGIFVYIPLAGSVMAFQDYKLTRGISGSEWVGLKNFIYAFNTGSFTQVIKNTLVISLFKVVLGIIVEVIFALLLNEIAHKVSKKLFQTIIYLPYFLSWVILSGVFVSLLSPSGGLVNQLLNGLGLDSIYFLGDNKWFPGTMIVTDIWKTFGYGTVVFLAALTGIDKTLYEAAAIDGAGRWKQAIHITIPGISTMIILITVMGIGNILSAGFDQIYNMLSPSVYASGDIIDTLVYRLAIEQGQYSISTAVGLMKSVVSFVLISLAYFAADKFADYKIF